MCGMSNGWGFQARKQSTLTGSLKKYGLLIQFKTFPRRAKSECLRDSEFFSKYVKVVLTAVVAHDVRAAGNNKPVDLFNCVGQLGSSRSSRFTLSRYRDSMRKLHCVLEVRSNLTNSILCSSIEVFDFHRGRCAVPGGQTTVTFEERCRGNLRALYGAIKYVSGLVWYKISSDLSVSLVGD
jgi:hypothetical protein